MPNAAEESVTPQPLAILQLDDQARCISRCAMAAIDIFDWTSPACSAIVTASFLQRSRGIL
jgi:hypothetical protein